MAATVVTVEFGTIHHYCTKVYLNGYEKKEMLFLKLSVSTLHMLFYEHDELVMHYQKYIY